MLRLTRDLQNWKKNKRVVFISIESDFDNISSRLINLARAYTHIYTQYVQLYILHIVVKGISAFRTNAHSFLRFSNFLWQRNSVFCLLANRFSNIRFNLCWDVAVSNVQIQWYFTRKKNSLEVCWKSSLWFNSSDKRFKFQINSTNKKLYENLS